MDVRGLQLLAQPLDRRFGLEPQRVVGLDAHHQVHAALEVEAEIQIFCIRRVERPDRERDDRDE